MRGIIYCIKESGEGYDSPIYIGSTNNYYKRYNIHKSRSNNNCGKIYEYIRENGGWDNFEMLEIGVVDYETSEELRKEEQKWIEDLGATLNDYRAYMTQEEQKQYKKEYHKKNGKKYYENRNKKRNVKIQCECGAIVSKANRSKHRKTNRHIQLIA